MQVLKPSVVPVGLNKYTEKGIHGMLILALCSTLTRLSAFISSVTGRDPASLVKASFRT